METTALYDSIMSPTPTVANCSNSTDCLLDEADYIRLYLGWRYRGLCESVILTIIYATILLTGVIGNVSTCVVIASNRAMHSPTNFYLLSLAVSDVLTLCLGTTPPVSRPFIGGVAGLLGTAYGCRPLFRPPIFEI